MWSSDCTSNQRSPLRLRDHTLGFSRQQPRGCAKNPNAHDWTQYFRYVLQTLEGKGEEEVAKRESQLRSVIKAVIPCDITKDPLLPLDYEGPYDVVLESLALALVGNTDADLVAALTRISKLIKPGGGSSARQSWRKGPLYLVCTHIQLATATLPS